MISKKCYARYTIRMTEYYELHEMCDSDTYEINTLREVAYYEEIRDIKLDDFRELYDKFK